MRQELEVVLERRDELPSFHEISRGQSRISDDRWKTFFLYAYGFKADGNCRRCPETTRIVEAIPGMKTAFFSILAPGKHIPAHRGPYRGVIRYHLGLRVPEPRDHCRIRVGDEIRHWEEGKSLVFDDTYEHEVWNDTPGTRVVLFVDFVRPLRFPASSLNRLLLKLIGWSPYVQDGVENYKRVGAEIR
jgi:beta-hydroxylase